MINAYQLLIILVNYRTPRLTLDCLATIALNLPEIPGLQVVVVDNASGDDSLQQIQTGVHRNGWQSWAHLVQSDRNRGFAGGNNFGITHAAGLGLHAEYVLLLNTDTLIGPNTLSRSLAAMKADPRI